MEIAPEAVAHEKCVCTCHRAEQWYPLQSVARQLCFPSVEALRQWLRIRKEEFPPRYVRTAIPFRVLSQDEVARIERFRIMDAQTYAKHPMNPFNVKPAASNTA